MKRACLTLLALSLLLGPDLATAQGRYKDLKFYGKCTTVTYVDLLTDEESHIMSCNKQGLFDVSSIAIRYGKFLNSLRLTISLTSGDGVYGYLGRIIPVKIRIDQGQLISRNAIWTSRPEPPQTATVLDEDLARRLLHNLARGQKAITQIGDDSITFELDGSAHAIQDFKRRAGLQPK